MSQEVWMWAIGVFITLSLGWGTLLIAAFTRLSGLVASLREDVDRKKADSDAQLDRIRADFVRRVDLDNHIQRLGEDVRDLRSELQTNNSAINQRLDAMLAALIAANKNPNTN